MAELAVSMALGACVALQSGCRAKSGPKVDPGLFRDVETVGAVLRRR